MLGKGDNNMKLTLSNDDGTLCEWDIESTKDIDGKDYERMIKHYIKMLGE